MLKNPKNPDFTLKMSGDLFKKWYSVSSVPLMEPLKLLLLSSISSLADNLINTMLEEQINKRISTAHLNGHC